MTQYCKIVFVYDQSVMKYNHLQKITIELNLELSSLNYIFTYVILTDDTRFIVNSA